MRRRTTHSLVVLLLGALLGGGCGESMRSNEPEPPVDPFKEGTGWFYHYVRANSFTSEHGHFEYPSTPYSSITARINDDFYTDRACPTS